MSSSRRHSHRQEHPKHSKKQATSKSFSFLFYRYELTKVFSRYRSIVPDVQDFWLFVKKYEAIEEKRSDASLSDSASDSDDDSSAFPKIHRSSYFVNIGITLTREDIIALLILEEDHILRNYIGKFIKLICLYINYKQKESFSAMWKILTAQANLPVNQYRDEILQKVKEERVVIIAGDTGCGKSTQIPQYLMKAGYNRIACTQPRRIACVSLSKRVSRETFSEHESKVGFQIRFDKNCNPDTKIIFITEGLLLRQANSGNMLSEYDIIVLDEVHERHLYGDFLLGITKCLLHQRESFKLVLMSATINIELFSNYFGKFAKIIQVPGRLYPIQVEHHPVICKDSKDGFDAAPYIRIMQMIDKKYPKDERGDVLMFLSGLKEITAVVDAATEYNERVGTWCILSLHSSLSLADQDKVFDYPPEGHRKCVVSTNIAETSITIDGIRFVVDSGKVKELSYDPVCKMQTLKEFWVSRASAEQRKGRAGRTGPGVCFRLYSEEEYAAMSQYTRPEIQRVPLDSVLLQMIAMGLPDVRKFPFIEPPDDSSLENSLSALKQYGALTSEEKLTEIGKMLSKLPIEIPMGKMLIMGCLFQQTEAILSLAAALSVQSPFTNKAFRDLDMLEARKELESDHGDAITLLNIFRQWLKIKEECGTERGDKRKSRHWCKKRGLEEQRFYEMTKLRTQFKQLLQDSELLEEIPEKSMEEMTSHERALRHGELKQLRQEKRKHQKEGPRKPKILKTNRVFEAEDGDEDTEDIRDVEFRLKHNAQQVKDLLKGSTATSYKDVMMLKVILCSALYPQIAIADEHNSSKTVKDQLYHTFGKPYVNIHPNSIFAYQSEVLQLQDSDIMVSPANFKTRHPLSSKHQILLYMSLLETTKAYLMNTIRMPAAQTLLLFCQEIHTTADFKRIICDSWIELKFLCGNAAENLLMKICKIRSNWKKLLVTRLEGKQDKKLKDHVMNELMQVLSIEIYYTVKRLLAADMKNIYLRTEYKSLSDVNPFVEGYVPLPNLKIGGLNLAEFLVYNCLLDDANAIEEWKCPICDLVAFLPALERLQHLHSHSSSTEDTSSRSQNKEEKSNVQVTAKKPNGKLYHCAKCDKDLFLTPTEILRHNKQHTT